MWTMGTSLESLLYSSEALAEIYQLNTPNILVESGNGGILAQNYPTEDNHR